MLHIDENKSFKCIQKKVHLVNVDLVNFPDLGRGGQAGGGRPERGRPEGIAWGAG